MHKPEAVIRTLDRFYREQNSNVHRGLHQLSQETTERYEALRRKVAGLINADKEREIVFCRGATEAINLVAGSYGELRVGRGDRILVSEMEHHANLVPWQQLAERKDAELAVIPMNDDGVLRLDAFGERLTKRTRIVAVSHASNALGTINPVESITDAAHAVGAVVVVEGAQAVSHLSVDVQALDCDFYVLSGHKMFGPTGIGALYGRASLLERMPPYQTGGEMIREVTFEGTTFREPPARFETGTPNIAGAVALAGRCKTRWPSKLRLRERGTVSKSYLESSPSPCFLKLSDAPFEFCSGLLGTAVDYLTAHGGERLRQHDERLLAYATDWLTNADRSETERAISQVHRLLTEDSSVDADDLPKLRALGGVHRFPIRVKCATLPWHALRAALDGEGQASTE